MIKGNHNIILLMNEYYVTIYCNVFLVVVRGEFPFCALCGHGGHSAHLRQWFSQGDEECPTGCGCRCCQVAEDIDSTGIIGFQDTPDPMGSAYPSMDDLNNFYSMDYLFLEDDLNIKDEEPFGDLDNLFFHT